MCALLWLSAGVAGCSSGGGEAPDGGRADAGPGDAGPSPLTGRPYGLHVPPSYRAGTAAPLLIMLHGYGWSGAGEEGDYLHLSALADAEGFLYAYPDGVVDAQGNRYWNATDACCNFYGGTTDDVAYLGALIDDVQARYDVDARRVFVYGHSNGGFMANRLACELSPRIAAFVSMAGETWKDPSRCAPSSPVSMIQFQGSADETVGYDGGVLVPGFAAYPGAAETAADWAALEGCSGAVEDGGTLPGVVTGDLINIARYSGCARGAVELWTVPGGPHIPQLDQAWWSPFWAFLAAHPKP